MNDKTEEKGPVPAGRRRLTVDLPMEDSDLLRAGAQEAGVNMTTMLIRAIRLSVEVERLMRAGGKITVEEASGERSRLRLV